VRRTEEAEKRVAAAKTFEAIAGEWLTVKNAGWVSSQCAKEKRRLELHALPWIGKMTISEIRASDVRPLLDRLVKRGTLDMAHRLLQQISAIFRFAARDDRAGNDPAGALAGTLPEHTKRGYAALTNPADISGLLRAIDGFKGQLPTHCALRLAPLLFVRPGELRAAEWSEIGLDKAEWKIPAAKRKLRKRFKEDASAPAHIVPLPDQAVMILKEFHPLTGHRNYVFPARGTNVDRCPTRR
jgi:integrase